MPGALGVYNTTMAQGSQWKRRFTYKLDDTPVNLTGWSAQMQIRRNYESDPLVTLTDGAGIILGGVAGTIDVDVGTAVTDAIEVLALEDPKRWPKADVLLYDIELISGGQALRFLEGRIEFSRQVTRVP